MPTPLRLLDKPPKRLAQPGDCWFAPWMITDGWVSVQYERDHLGKRLPLMITLPNGFTWSPDHWPSGADATRDGWAVTGDVPNITVTPSINAGFPGEPSGYHGWVTNGVLSDDLEGRTYPRSS